MKKPGFKLRQARLVNIDDKSIRFKVLFSSSSQIICQILGALLAVITLKLITSSLGLKNYGLYATALAFVSTFSLLTDLGLSAITGREIAKFPEKADDIIGHNMGLRIALSTIAIPIIIVISLFLYPNEEGSLKLIIAVLSSYLIFDAVRSVSMAYFSAKVRNDIAALVGLFQQIMLFALTLFVWIIDKGIYFYVSIFILSNASSALLGIVVARKYVNVRPRINISKWLTNIRLSISLGIILIVNILYLKIDTLLLSIFKSSTEVAIYGVAYSLILTFMTVPGIIMTSLVPSMTISKTTEELKSIVEKAYIYLAILACLFVAGGYAVRESVVIVISNDEFRLAAVPFAILCFATAFSFMNNVFGFASVAINKHHKLVFVSIGTLLLNVLLNIVLIPKYSVIGAAWATVVSEFISVFLVYKIFSYESNIHIKIFAYLYKPAAAAVFTVLIIYRYGHNFQINQILLNTFLNAIIAIITFTVIMIILRGWPSEIITLCRKIPTILKR